MLKVDCAKKHFKVLGLGEDFMYNVQTTYQYGGVVSFQPSKYARIIDVTQLCLVCSCLSLDKAVEKAYSVDFNRDEKIVAHLFKLYTEITEGNQAQRSSYSLSSFSKHCSSLFVMFA